MARSLDHHQLVSALKIIDRIEDFLFKRFEKSILIPCAHYYYEDAVDDKTRIDEQW